MAKKGQKFRSFSQEFKLKAVKMYHEEHKGVETIAKELGLPSHSYVRRWLKAYAAEGLKDQRSMPAKEGNDHEIKQILSLEYHRLKGIYGYRRMRILLKRKYGIHVNHKRAYRLMKLLQLQAVIRRRRPYTQYSSYGNE
ncbi:IS3 family transposase, partial [Polycladomyces subterraneus]|uniref:IS3 family transposase n=1 Tax=Polycladomyces subterraneus TaxID=1016997 RepID=UPI003F4E0FEF